jgi:hypothetical protein
MGMTV